MDMDMDFELYGGIPPGGGIPRVEVIQKANNVCAYCRIRKQRCDRLLPSCSRCAVKDRPCDYTPALELRHISSHESLTDNSFPIWLPLGPHGPDLSSRGRDQLLQAIIDDVNQIRGSRHTFAELVSEILESASVSVAGLLQEYASCMLRWIPLVSLDTFDPDRHDDQLPGPIMLLSMFLVTKRPFGNSDYLKTSTLYTTIKQIYAILQTSGEVHLEVVQAMMIVSIYECAHGMARQAHITLGACMSLVNLLDVDAQQGAKGQPTEETLNPLHVSILVLDRIIVLSSLNPRLPLICPPSHPLAQNISSFLSRHEIGPYQTDPILRARRKIKVQAQVTVATGRVLDFIHASTQAKQPAEKYEDLSKDLEAVVHSLVNKEGPHSWLMCDCIAMGFSALLLLHQCRVQMLPDPDVKSIMALQYSRRMAWDMNVLLIEKLKAEPEISHLPFGGLCCVVRAAVAVAHSGEALGGDYDKIDGKDVATILPSLGKFSERWKVGASYKDQVETAIGCYSCPGALIGLRN